MYQEFRPIIEQRLARTRDADIGLSAVCTKGFTDALISQAVSLAETVSASFHRGVPLRTTLARRSLEGFDAETFMVESYGRNPSTNSGRSRVALGEMPDCRYITEQWIKEVLRDEIARLLIVEQLHVSADATVEQS
jgi:hypothetical protein